MPENTAQPMLIPAVLLIIAQQITLKSNFSICNFSITLKILLEKMELDGSSEEI